MERKRVAEATKGIGRPKVGGPFELVDTEGKPFTHENLKGRYALVSSRLESCTHGCTDDGDWKHVADLWLIS
jgi:protein SCO1